MWKLFLIIYCAARITGLPSQPQDPVIAVVTSPLSDCPVPPSDLQPQPTACVESYFVRWLETAGIRVIPLPWDAPKSVREEILTGANGVLYPGGGLGGEAWDVYVSNATEVFNFALSTAKSGNPFFIWGTCQGFQVLATIASQNSSLLHCDYHGTYPSMLPLYFTAAQPKSILFGTFTTPPDILDILKTKNSTLNWHVCGITPSVVESEIPFSSRFNVLSTNTDVNGQPFISSFEGKDSINIFATQFHPERVPYEFSNDIIGHSEDDVKVSLYLSLFISTRLRLNNNSFPDAARVDKRTLENYPLTNYGYGSQVYWL